MRRKLISVLATLPLYSLAAAPPVAIHEWKVRQEPTRMAQMVNCEDQDVQPCITYDEGAWRRVDSYKPYTAHKVNLCNRKKSNLPCTTTSYRYYWKGNF